MNPDLQHRQASLVYALPLVEQILASHQHRLGSGYAGYRNHVYRVVHLCLSFAGNTAEDIEKIQIAGAFHDIGLWTAQTLDYLPPSAHGAADYLRHIGKEGWIDEISAMIEMHHAVRSRAADHSRLVENFRRADIADFSLGVFAMGLPRSTISALKRQFPNLGFHWFLFKRGMAWFFRHPLNPLPMFRW
ncbi:HD domain-containing protein [Rheinheimera sp.]|uniref:HD domain-containing protein n=1 Tax=Rheinheimera sp. TaxID=1869214 RepID=UPI00307DAEC9